MLQQSTQSLPNTTYREGTSTMNLDGRARLDRISIHTAGTIPSDMSPSVHRNLPNLLVHQRLLIRRGLCVEGIPHAPQREPVALDPRPSHSGPWSHLAFITVASTNVTDTIARRSHASGSVVCKLYYWALLHHSLARTNSYDLASSPKRGCEANHKIRGPCIEERHIEFRVF
jgi:hypothetical protein